MPETLWEPLHLTPEEEQLVEKIRLGGTGQSLPRGELERHHAGAERDFTIPTRVGDTLVHYYRSEGPATPACRSSS